MNNIKILETLKLQPLTEEEKAKRHILGRWYGPIATCDESTRNGRRYNRELWEKALNDELFHEKIANKCLFLELGHPVDREEIDMSKVCACIPEMPKIINGDLCACVDILDTPNGRILKTLCDYGFIPGVSSRGSGDVLSNNDVDPETFFLETFDCVAIPAVKKARLSMCESLTPESAKLKRALTESFNSASEEDKAIMKETFEQLDIEIEEEDPFPDIPYVEGEEPLLEETEEEEEEETETVEEITDEEAQDAAEEEEIEDEAEVVETFTVGDMIKSLKDFEEEVTLEFAPITIDGVDYTVTELTMDDSEEGKVLINFVYDSSEADEADANDNIEEVEVEAEEEVALEEEPAEDDLATEEAVDNGDDEVMESLKDMVRQKEALEEEIQSLKNQNAVRGAEVSRLEEELEKYRTGFMRVSELASKSTRLQKEVSSLNEQLTAKNSTIRTLQEKVNKHTTLTESIDASKRTVKDLREKLATIQEETDATEHELREQLAETRAKSQERANIAKAYKQKYNAVMEHYIASKAQMLGVNVRDITSKLHEGYTLQDIDNICDTLLDAGRPAFHLGIGNQAKATVKLKEEAVRPRSPEYGYDIDDDLLVLAGLK